MDKRVALASDDIGFQRKEEIKKYLENKGYEIVYDPVKTSEDGKNTFAKLADAMAEQIQKDNVRVGLYVCGTGIGFTTQINKHWGIRATAVTNPYSAKRARLSNNVQVAGLGVRVNGLPMMEMIVDSFLEEPFDFATARENSKKNLLEAKRDDDQFLRKPDYVAWNMGFEPDN
ncbi:MAG: RpiB/LacA/LacB family sugar-phosphate isomerase [Lacticaseibacillus paracasei]